MSAELLRRAARHLRTTAEHLPVVAKGSWTCDTDEVWAIKTRIAQTLHDDGDEVPSYIALMHPPVALALASMLTEVAESLEQDGDVVMDSTTAEALTVARAILREPS